MPELRSLAVQAATSRTLRRIDRPLDAHGKPLPISAFFGSHVFGLDQIKEKLTQESYDVLLNLVSKGHALSPSVADEVAGIIKDWALGFGVTHYCHWFQPMTGLTAEKHDAFIHARTTPTGQTLVIEKFSGGALIQSEPDASSFPSGGMRSTFEARGYTAWDPTSPVFIIEGLNGKTLCIPSVFMGYHGQALDTKTPLLRSNEALTREGVRFLKLLGDVDVTNISATLGVEQEYFLVDRALFSARPDLLMTGRTLIGRASTRGQQFEDHYFGSIPSRVLAFMNELEVELYRLGIPIKTRHNEVAPGQFELAPIFEPSELAADHNALVMDILCRVALRHDFVCLLHEKPFSGINGSGKHNNWSLCTQKGDNLLDPGKTPHQNLRFLAILSAILKAVHDHGDMLRVGIASASNDHRLGANEAPPAIISIFLGDSLHNILEVIESGKPLPEKTQEAMLSLGVSKLPLIARDNTDRNRTSPFAFTGNKFEFRAVGSSSNVAYPVSILNAAVADSFSQLSTRLEQKLSQGLARDQAIMSLVKEVVIETKAIRFEGNNYSEAWKKEAIKRGLPNLTTTPEALKVFENPKSTAFLIAQKVFSPEEVSARHHIMLERYIKQIEMEAATLIEMVDTFVLPALEENALRLGRLSSAMGSELEVPFVVRLKDMGALLNTLIRQRADLEEALKVNSAALPESQRAHDLCQKVLPLMESIRTTCDTVEGSVSDGVWPLPKYRELLFLR